MIYIHDDDYRLLVKNAKLTGRSLSEQIREAVGYYLKNALRRPSWDSDPVWGLAGSAKADQPNADSLHHDQILYGEKR
jgi:hypothetical protein